MHLRCSLFTTCCVARPWLHLWHACHLIILRPQLTCPRLQTVNLICFLVVNAVKLSDQCNFYDSLYAWTNLVQFTCWNAVSPGFAGVWLMRTQICMVPGREVLPSRCRLTPVACWCS